jgi:hypothetical protein
MSFTNIRSPAMAGALARRLREAIGAMAHKKPLRPEARRG